MFEECGCKVEISGVLQIGNKVMTDNSWVGIIFSTKLLEDNIKFDKNEILDVKWFSYEEILGMKNELRSYEWITDAITAYVNNRISGVDIVKIF